MSEKIKKLFRDKFLKQNCYTRISELEWCLISEELKQEFMNNHYSNSKLLPDFITKEMQEPFRSNYINKMICNGYRPEDFGFSYKDLSKDLLEKLIENILGADSISDDLFDLFTTEQKIHHIKNSGENGYSITEYQFNHLKPLEKLDFIIFNGCQDQFMIDWYETWKASVEREQQIDSVLK